jgi:hypothetical protein
VDDTTAEPVLFDQPSEERLRREMRTTHQEIPTRRCRQVRYGADVEVPFEA